MNDKACPRCRFDWLPINETNMTSPLELEDEDTVDGFQEHIGGV